MLFDAIKCILSRILQSHPWKNKTYQLRSLCYSSRLLEKSDMNNSWCRRQGTEDAPGESTRLLKGKHMGNTKIKRKILITWLHKHLKFLQEKIHKWNWNLETGKKIGHIKSHLPSYVKSIYKSIWKGQQPNRNVGKVYQLDQSLERKNKYFQPDW